MSLPLRHTLLIIDENEQDLETAVEFLGDEYAIVTARSANEGAEVLKTREVHLVLTDQGLPQMLQKWFLKQMKGHCPEAVQTVFTGEAELDLIIDAINQGYLFRYVAKPWNPAGLKDVLAVAVQQYDQYLERELLLQELEEKNKKLQASNEQLKELDRLRTSFMAVASHELRTPVTLIGGFATLLEAVAEKVTPDSLRDTTGKIREGARRLEHIIRGMFQMLESGKVDDTLHLESHRPADLLQQALEDARPFIQKRKLNVEVRLGEAPAIMVDVSKIKDVLDNILLNAIKFTPDGGRIDVSVRYGEESHLVEFVVRDHGVGIPEEELSHVFTPMFGTFNTLHHSSGVYEFQRRGLGLGLAVSKKFVDLHGGEIDVDSRVGEGTAITVQLPDKQA